jgi:hypothetical protein
VVVRVISRRKGSSLHFFYEVGRKNKEQKDVCLLDRLNLKRILLCFLLLVLGSRALVPFSEILKLGFEINRDFICYYFDWIGKKGA